MSCHFCYNAYVWANEPHNEEDYFDGGLTPDNDGSSCGIGTAETGHCLYFNSGMGVPCNIEACEWGEDQRWHTVARYYPKFCPECGRKLDEFIIGERGASFNKAVD